MADASDVPQEAAQAARMAASRRGVGQMARLGFFAIGVVYASIGVLAMLGVLGVGAGQYTGSFGAVRTLRTQPYGRVILGVLAAGVAAYVAWRLAQSLFDVENRGTALGGLLRRGGLLLSALAYILLLARLLVHVVIGKQAQAKASDWTQPLMHSTAGLVLIGLAGLVMLGVTAAQFRSAYGAAFLEQIDASEASRRSMAALGRFGFFSRGVVFGIIGVFLLLSALHADPRSAKGLGGALQALGQEPYGHVLIGVAAVGLFSYGLFMIAKARFRYLAPGTPRDSGEETPPEQQHDQQRREEA